MLVVGVLAAVPVWAFGRKRGVGAEKHEATLRAVGATGVAAFAGGWGFMLFFGGHTAGPEIVVAGFAVAWVCYLLCYRGVLRRGDPTAEGHPDVEGYPRG